jgi:hypothetical protein
MRILNLLLSAIILLISFNPSSGQAPSIDWQVNLGGSDLENGQSVAETGDSGFVAVGYTQSVNGHVTGNHGSSEVWVIRLNPAGNVLWKKCYGGTDAEQASTVIHTLEGDILVAGFSGSNNGDVIGNHGFSDFWLLRLNLQGQILSQKCFGGSLDDRAAYLLQTADSGYLMTGYTTSNDQDVSGFRGVSDIWVVRLNSDFEIMWQRCLGGSDEDAGNWAAETADGGFVIAGYSKSTDQDAAGNHGNRDGILIKLDSLGNTQWSTCIGGSNEDVIYSVALQNDGSVMALGKALSTDGDITNHHGGSGRDYLLTSVDSAGAIRWVKCLGGTKDDCAYAISKTAQGSYLLIGHSYSNDGDVSGNHQTGRPDFWLLNVDSAGNKLWDKCYGGMEATGQTGDNPYAVIPTSDGGILMTGRSESYDGDISNNHGEEDMWVVKLEGNLIAEQTISTGLISPLTYEAGATVIVPFTANGSFNEGNTFTAELSDPLGNFLLPTPLGSVSSTSSGSITATIPESVVGGSLYRIRVVSSNPPVAGKDDNFDITITNGPAPCVAPTGLTSSNISSSSAKLSWAAAAEAISYKVRYKKTGTNPWITNSSSTTSKTIFGLSPSTNYTWQVKSICQNNPSISSSWSAQQQFTTMPARLGQETYAGPELYPNPASGATVISLFLTSGEAVAVELFDLYGKSALRMHLNLEEGWHQVAIDLSEVIPGVYLMRIKTGEHVYFERLVVQ